MSRLGIIAGGGALPAALAAADPDALCVAFSGAEIALPETRIQRHRMEHLGALFYALREAGVTRVVLAGAMSRPALDPAALDPVMAALAPRIMAAMQGGDDGLLRLVIAIFEEQGFAVIGAHDLLPDLTARPDEIGSKPQRPAISLFGSDIIAYSLIDQTQIAPGPRIIRIESNRPLKRFLRQTQLAPFVLRQT